MIYIRLENQVVEKTFSYYDARLISPWQFRLEFTSRKSEDISRNIIRASIIVIGRANPYGSSGRFVLSIIIVRDSAVVCARSDGD